MKTITSQTKRTRTRRPNNKTTTSYRISDDLWAVLQPLLPSHPNTHRFGGGRPRVPDRLCADAIFYVLRTGCQWHALDQTGLCAHSTAHERYQQWVQADVFLKLWQAGVAQFDELKGLDWTWLSMDGAITKAPLGGQETGRNPTDRGKSGVKRSVLSDGHGVPLALAVSGANRHDMKLTQPTLETLVVERPKPTPAHAQSICLEAGYDYQEVRDLLADFGLMAHIRSRHDEAIELKQKAGSRARRWVVERTHSWLNRFRRILIRWEKKPENYIGFLHFACALIAFRAAGLFG